MPGVPWWSVRCTLKHSKRRQTVHNIRHSIHSNTRSILHEVLGRSAQLYCSTRTPSRRSYAWLTKHDKPIVQKAGVLHTILGLACFSPQSSDFNKIINPWVTTLEELTLSRNSMLKSCIILKKRR